MALAVYGSPVRAYEFEAEDDSVLCQGFSPEMYYQRMQQRTNQQRAMYIDYQRAIEEESISRERTFEMIKSARRARIQKEASRRDELIAKRRAENPTNIAAKSPPPIGMNKTANLSSP